MGVLHIFWGYKHLQPMLPGSPGRDDRIVPIEDGKNNADDGCQILGLGLQNSTLDTKLNGIY